MKVSLFITCLADHFFPEAGEAVVHLLRRQGVQVEFPAQQTCCGQPPWNTGQEAEAKALAKHYIQTFEDSEYIVMPSGSCAGHVRHYYPMMFEDDKAWAARARSVAARSFEFSEFMVKVLGVTDVGARFKARVVYHNSCHMQRELGVYQEPVQLLKAVRDLELVEAPRQDLCCGFGGAFAVKQAGISTAMGDEKLSHIASTGADLLVSADYGCLMHLTGRASRTGVAIRSMHLADLLWKGVQNA